MWAFYILDALSRVERAVYDSIAGNAFADPICGEHTALPVLSPRSEKRHMLGVQFPTQGAGVGVVGPEFAAPSAPYRFLLQQEQFL